MLLPGSRLICVSSSASSFAFLSCLLRGIIVIPVLKHALYEFVRRPQPARGRLRPRLPRARPRPRGAHGHPYADRFALIPGPHALRPRARAKRHCGLQSKAHHKLAREWGVADDYLYDSLCGIQAFIDAGWAAEGFCAACVARCGRAGARRCGIIWTFGSGLPRFGLESNISLVWLGA
ncbi:hypothetical protein FB451DRAFT_1417054 [Mycena latifolia]|nr:hypothetical protein FB451DRAFT_1417054 [Mycena latifolia]